MAEHLTLVSLRKALSARSNISEKVADDFLASLTSAIQEGLQKDGSVTVNGLGTFKVQDVPARESINVVTGERFTIAGYKKVGFVEEKNRPTPSLMREEPERGISVRKGAKAGPAKNEPVDPIQKLGEQAEEIKDILSELNAMSSDIPATGNTEPAPIEIEPVAVPVGIGEPATPAAEPAGTTADAEQPKQAEKTKDETKPFNPWLTGLITIGVFAMLLIIAYFVLRHKIVSWADGMRTTIEQRVSATPEEPAATDVQAVIPEATEEPQSSEPAETTEASQAPVNPLFDDNQRKFTEFQAEETVGQDSRLAWIAKKRYGEKAYWVFIYEVNRDRLSSPDHVLPGMQLRVPKLPAELRDPNEPKTKALLERLSEKYLK